MVSIDKVQFEKLCGLVCTKGEIAGFFNCSEDTIDRYCQREYGETFSVVLERYSYQSKINLRRNQFKLAEKNAAMAIFLGKNYLGQRDVPIDEDSSTMDKLDEILQGLRDKANDRTKPKTE